eukprot:4158681-Pyramimonas_sp.AAC.1
MAGPIMRCGRGRGRTAWRSSNFLIAGGSWLDGHHHTECNQVWGQRMRNNEKQPSHFFRPHINPMTIAPGGRESNGLGNGSTNPFARARRSKDRLAVLPRGDTGGLPHARRIGSDITNPA